MVERIWFHAAERKKKPWHVVVVVDQSGSMLESRHLLGGDGIHLRRVAGGEDVAGAVRYGDRGPVGSGRAAGRRAAERVQLGGGTDIAKAMNYSSTLVRQPPQDHLVLITDFFEGGDESRLVEQTRQMATQRHSHDRPTRSGTTHGRRTASPPPPSSARWDNQVLLLLRLNLLFHLHLYHKTSYKYLIHTFFPLPIQE